MNLSLGYTTDETAAASSFLMVAPPHSNPTNPKAHIHSMWCNRR